MWDLPSAVLVDVILCQAPCLSLSYSPTGEYLATVHKDLLGVYLWASKSLYVKTLNLKALPNDFRPSEVIELPETSGDQTTGCQSMEGVEIIEVRNAYLVFVHYPYFLYRSNIKCRF